MTQTAPALRLNPSQIAQLIGYCKTYRSYLWQSIMPTPERNQAIRSIQALQGRLEKAQEQKQAEITLSLITEEKNTIKHLLRGLIQLYGTTQPSEQRDQVLGEITKFRIEAQRMFHQTQAFEAARGGKG